MRGQIPPPRRRRNDPQLKNLFEQLAQVEQQHLDAIAQMMPGHGLQARGLRDRAGHVHGRVQQRRLAAKAKRLLPLASDVLTMEKHASHLYDTCVFEFRDADARSVLNDIQAQEQHHGKVIYDYMAANAMYA